MQKWDISVTVNSVDYTNPRLLKHGSEIAALSFKYRHYGPYFGECSLRGGVTVAMLMK